MGNEFVLAKGLLSTVLAGAGCGHLTPRPNITGTTKVINRLMWRDMTTSDSCHTTAINSRIMYVSYLRFLLRFSIIITFLHFGHKRVQERDDFMESLTEGGRKEIDIRDNEVLQGVLYLS